MVLGFQGSVQPFVPSILLRVGRLDQLGGDTQAEWQPRAGEQEAAVAVDDGEGIAVEPVAGFELTFEVRGPDLVGRLHEGIGPAGVAQVGPASGLGD